MTTVRNDLGQYDEWDWWGEERHVRILHAIVPARMRYFGPIVGGWGGKHVVDVGCGGGFMSEALAEAGAHVIGVDRSAAALDKARAHAQARGLAIDYRVGLGERLPVDDASADVAVCVDVLEHVDDVRATCAEIARVVRPGGLFLFDTFAKTWLSWLVGIKIAEDWLRWVPAGTHDWEKFLPPDQLLRTLHDVGFEGGETVGLGVTGVGRRLLPKFGRYPSKAIQYMGWVRRA